MSSSRLSRFLSVALRVFLRSTLREVLSLTFPAILLASFNCELRAQTNEWRWETGSSTDPANGSYQPGVFGTQGVGAAANTPWSAVSPVSWADANGDLWLFGGANGPHTELWKYSTLAGEWTWVAGSNSSPFPTYGTLGVASAANVPGSRFGGVGWSDKNGHLWLFGGLGNVDSSGNSAFMNDLWEFNPAINQWTWQTGSSSIGPNCDVEGPAQGECGQAGVYGTKGAPAPGNTPGSRSNATTWTDTAGNLWLFGGQGYDSQGHYGDLNDVWKFDMSVKQWAWIGGPDTLSHCVEDSFGICVFYGQPGVYGTMGSSSATNSPGGRYSATGAADSKGNLWMFGGYGIDQAGIRGGELDDVWEFDIASGQWTWMNGNGTAVMTSSYGILGVPSASNVPPGRQGAVGWFDKAGNLWVFSGQGYDGSSQIGAFNDLWKFDTSTHQWAWMGGGSSFRYCINQSRAGCGQPGVYGTQGTAAVGNLPGSRIFATGWVDAGGNFWLFGGVGFTSTTTNTYNLNDFWEYQPSPNTLPAAITPAFSPGAGTYNTPQAVTISNGMSNATIYYTTDGSTPTTSSNAYSGPVTVSSTETLTAVAIASGYPTSAVAAATYTIIPLAATPTFSPAAGTYTSPQTVTISDTTPGATIYYTTDGSTPTVSSTVYSGPITVSTTETIKAIATAAGYGTSTVASVDYSLPVTFQLTASAQSLTIKAGAAGTLTLTITPQNGFNSTVSFACLDLPAGASCSFNPATVKASSPTTTTVTISASAQTAALGTELRPLLPGGVLAAAFCIFGWRRKRLMRTLSLLIALGAGLSMFSACNSSGKPVQQPVTSKIQITGTSGSVMQSMDVNLTVN